MAAVSVSFSSLAVRLTVFLCNVINCCLSKLNDDDDDDDDDDDGHICRPIN